MATATHTRSSPTAARVLQTPTKRCCYDRAPRRIPLSDSAQRAQRKLQLAVVGGFLAGSLAIMADAAHLLTDVAAFCISLLAIWMSTHPATNRLTFGFQRTEVIGAVTSVLVLWALTGVLVYAAVIRFIDCLQPNPTEYVDGKLMFIVACIGLLAMVIRMEGAHMAIRTTGPVVTGIHMETETPMHTDIRIKNMAFDNGGIYHSLSPRRHGHSHEEGHSHGHGHAHGKHSFGGELEVGQMEGSVKTKKNMENLNIRSAYIHALGDFIQSIGVCIAGGLIWLKPEWQIADPIATFVFSILVLFTTVSIVRDSLHILMEGSPEGMDTEEIQLGLRACSSVIGVHDLHIWSLSAGLPSLSVHIVADDVEAAQHATQHFLLSKGITHSTIQTEKTSSNCASDLKCGQVLSATTHNSG
ncbi:Cation efflux protein transmembrane domain [Phytophthora cactorum]|nr:Cation efflux protein transmembrane domain [Phytophthora cactorum]